MADRITQKIAERKAKLSMESGRDGEEDDEVEGGSGDDQGEGEGESEDQGDLGNSDSEDNQSDGDSDGGSEVDSDDQDHNGKVGSKGTKKQEQVKKLTNKNKDEVGTDKISDLVTKQQQPQQQQPAPAKKKKITRNFASLGLSRPLLRAVEDLSYPEPTPIQAAAIPLIMMGKDVLGVWIVTRTIVALLLTGN